MKKLYFQCNSGISGDMTVAALLDLGADREVLEKALKSLCVDGYHIHIGKVKKCGIEAMDFNVHLKDHHEEAHHHNHDDESVHLHEHSHHHEHEKIHQHPHEHRNLNDIITIIQSGDFSEHAKKLAVDIFTVVAEAESKAHGLPIEEVHFHEVGAVDSIVDIVGAAVCLDNLGVSEVYCPYLCEGQGTVRCQHGIMPVPVPAVVNISQEHDLQLRLTDHQGEMVTPTGAAIIAGIRTSAKLPEQFKIIKTGIGAGKKDFSQANILRVFEIEVNSAELSENDMEHVAVLQANIDDQSSELLAYAMEQLFEAGAKDVWFEPIFMKKNRPAVILNVLCDSQNLEKFVKIIFRETSSIGVRYQYYDRIAMKRRIEEVKTEFGTLLVKRCSYQEIEKCYPEYETAKEAARSNQVSLETVYRAIFNALK